MKLLDIDHEGKRWLIPTDKILRIIEGSPGYINICLLGMEKPLTIQFSMDQIIKELGPDVVRKIKG